MAGFNTVSTFCDASGKLSDHKVVCFGGVAAYNERYAPFVNEWDRLLVRNGIRVLSAKTAFNASRPLSDRNKRLGLENRIEDLAPFINCIRKHLQVVTGVAIDVQAFKKLPTNFFEVYGDNPEYAAFARSLLKIVDFAGRDKIVFICDDDEEVAPLFYKLYRRIRKILSRARHGLVALTFADDRYVYGVQAADLVAGLIRLEAARKWFDADYDYGALFDALTKRPENFEPNLWDISIAFGDEATLTALADDLREERKKKAEDDST